MAVNRVLSNRGKIILLLFFLSSCINLWAEYTINHQLIYLSKPLLVSLLALFFFTESLTIASRFRKFIFAGLIFSVFGDIFLMFVEQNPEKGYFFLLGLGSFLIAHLLYLSAFGAYLGSKIGYCRKKPALAVPFLLFLICFNFYLWPSIPIDLKGPVFLYSLAIVSMSLACFNLKGSLNDGVFMGLLLGVLFFLFSDTIIGLNKFKPGSISWANPRILIMSTYLIAQLLISYFALKANDEIALNKSSIP